MLRSLLFQVEEDVEVSSNGVSHGVVSCLQWKSPNLAPLEVAAKQTLALMWCGRLDDGVLNVLETAHIHGALAPVGLITALERAYSRGLMSPVKLIALHDNDLRMLLDTKTSSNTAAAIEELWRDFTDLDATRRYSVAFASEDEILSGRSDYPNLDAARVLLESSSLDLEPYEFPDLDPFDPESFSPDDQWSLIHPSEGF